MKKFASIVASAALIGGGLVAAAPTATAVPTGDPYPGSIGTTCNANNLNNPRKGGNVRVRLNVRPDVDGNQDLRGPATFRYFRKSNNTVIREYRRLYRGPGVTKYAFSGVPRGRYTVKVFWNSKPNSSVYQNCSTSFSQRVRPRR
ncbi:hypothetical protein GCM10009623_12910 [Nocardioides aestuarii]|uniref:Carboxypeptidase regulatory-like domain-containing protein n=1 Tax=Nocardioides aestuarii TaxID=252231 RepID=A0ABW4TJ48_9ACTN